MKTPLYIEDLFRLSGYDPNQPRDPAGSPDGGQWAGGGADPAKDKQKPKKAEMQIPSKGDWEIKGGTPDAPFTFSNAKHTKGAVVVRTRFNGAATATRAGRLVSVMTNEKYSKEENGYLMSPSMARKFERYVIEGWDANVWSKAIDPP